MGFDVCIVELLIDYLIDEYLIDFYMFWSID